MDQYKEGQDNPFDAPVPRSAIDSAQPFSKKRIDNKNSTFFMIFDFVYLIQCKKKVNYNFKKFLLRTTCDSYI